MSKFIKYKSNGSMLDLFLLLALGFAVLFVLAFILIKPIIPKMEDIPVDEQLLIKLEWDDLAVNDLDLWIRTPSGDIVSFKRKDVGTVVLERDDVGTDSDIIVVNGVSTFVKDNTEVVRIKQLVDGVYYISVHHYNNGKANTANQGANLMAFLVTVYDGQAHKDLARYTGEVIVFGENPVMRIVVEDGQIVDYGSSTLQIALANGGNNG